MRIFVIGGTKVNANDALYEGELQKLAHICRPLGQAIAAQGHSLLVCSPFDGSADLEVIRGFAQSASVRVPLELHFPDTQEIKDRFTKVLQELGVTKSAPFPSQPPAAPSAEARTYAWLLAQLNAVERSQIVIAVGGKLDGAANMLLSVVASRGKPLLPSPVLGGAAAQAFSRHQYELFDKLKDRVLDLQDLEKVSEWVSLADTMVSGRGPMDERHHRPAVRFFISYPRARPCDADYVETILRRRNMIVLRDESEFGAGHEVPAQIRDAIHSADVFIVLWCREYACSPWCSDELDLALDRRESKKLEIWIFCVDDTRIVPRRARDLLHYSVQGRDELEGRLVTLLQRLKS